MENSKTPEKKKKKKENKDPPAILSASPDAQVDETSKGLLREFMHSKKFKKTLQAFDIEQPRSVNTIASRALMSDLLVLQKLQERNTKKEKPRTTLLEIFCEERVRRKDYAQARKSENSKLPAIDPEDSDTEEALQNQLQVKRDTRVQLRSEIQKKKDLQQKLSKAIAKEKKRSETAQLKLDKAKAKVKDTKKTKKGKSKSIDDILISGEKAIRKNKKKKATEEQSNSRQESSPVQTEESTVTPHPDDVHVSDTNYETDESIDSYTKDLQELKIGFSNHRSDEQSKSKQLGWDIDVNNNSEDIPTTTPPPIADDNTVADWDLNIKDRSLHVTMGRPIDLSTSRKLRELLCRDRKTIPEHWSQQGFYFSSIIKYGLVQNNGGPCGVLSVVQARVLKQLIVENGIDFGDCGSSITSEQQQTATIESLVDTLNIIAAGGSVILGFPPDLSQKKKFGDANITLESWRQQNVGRDVDALRGFITDNIEYYTDRNGTGLLSLVVSAVLTRGGPERVVSDMDEETGSLIVHHQYSSQEVVNLLLIGKATSNVFDGSKQLGTPPDVITMSGVDHSVPDIGFLSFRDFTGDVVVGDFYKNPPLPIFCIWNESHYTVCFSKSPTALSSPTAEVFYYDQLGCQDEEYHLSIDSGCQIQPRNNNELVPYMDDILRTREQWKGATVSWNGSEGLL